jgi:dTDP-4-dehydrorhamnose 3,5-epimerase
MSDPRFDASVTDAARDVATVDSSGSSLDGNLAGVVTKSPAVHVDHRGRLFEVYPGRDEFWADPVVFCHAFTVRPHGLKGWGLHFHKTDRYTLMVGEVMVALWDARLDSPTHGQFQRVFLSAEGVRQVSIPPGVWHASINLVGMESMVIDFPTQPYEHANPDKIRLSWDTPLAPVDLAQYFPIQFDPGRERPCG